ncbi:putative Alpha/beta-Hydrolases superfamily protein [Capsicum annuum]|nr:putative Alpha/beta-Hydrolases superfamily protein [Capsicum annuum]
MDTNFLSSVYHVGQLVSCIVLHLDDDKKEAGKRKIWLSLHLSSLHKSLTLDVIQEGMILSAYVKSMEDHGYIIHFGLPSFSGFMPKESGLTTHGWITKIENHSCFVRFYNGVQGFAPRSERGLDPGCEISSMYHVEQVVKCRVTSSNPASRRINLSFTMTPSRVFSNELVKPGNVVSGVVERVTPDAIVLDVTVQGHFKGTISPQHLSYHSGEYHPLNPLFLCNCFYCFKPLAGHAELMKSALRPGYEFDPLLVLDIDGSNFIPSAKHSLVTSAQQLPLDINQVRLNSVLHVNSETSRITVSLKQSFCSSTDASFIQEYFLVEKISKLQSVDSGGSDLRWVEQFNLGCTVKGKVHEIKEFGVVVGFQKLSGIPVETGSSIRTAVLDVSKIERLVDLSLKPVFVDKSKKETTNSQTQKKRKREMLGELEVNQTVNVVACLTFSVNQVVSVPSYNYTLGYASRADYNTPNFPPKSFTNGER